MTKQVSKVKVRNFRKRIKEVNDQELELRRSMKLLYDQFVLDVGDSEIALRHVRQAYFQIQKYRVQCQLAERMEFHPFFGMHPLSSHYHKQWEEDEEEDDDGII